MTFFVERGPVDLKMSYSWQTSEIETQQTLEIEKSEVFSHSCLPGVEWQLELHNWQGNVAVFFILVTNKHNFELPVKLSAAGAGSVSETVGKNRHTSKIRLPKDGYEKIYRQNRQVSSMFGAANKEQQFVSTISIEVSCPFITLPSNVTDGVEKLLTEAYKTDVQFVVQGVKIPAHKLLLSAASPVFDRMFSDESQFEEARSNTVVVDDVSAEAFEAFLRLVYTGDIDNNTLQEVDMALEVMSLGHKYQVDSVVRRASRAIKFELTTATVLRVAEASQLFKAHELRVACANFIAQDCNFDEISGEDEWTPFIEKNASFVNEVMIQMRYRSQK